MLVPADSRPVDDVVVELTVPLLCLSLGVRTGLRCVEIETLGAFEEGFRRR
jgi:hypothetical protein